MLRNKLNYKVYSLDNGIRLLHVKVAGDVSYCGAIINTGTRDEGPSESGYAHLVEHMLFKGTDKYNYTQLISRIEDVGGEINAYTTKEETVVYATFLRKYAGRCLALVSNMVSNSVFAPESLKKEVEVVKSEIDSYEDSPSEIILDEFEELIYSGNPLGRNILGTKRELGKVTRNKLLNFYKRTYTRDNILYFLLGNYTPAQVERFLSLIETGILAPKREYVRVPLSDYKSQNVTKHRDTCQTHIAIGNRSCHATSANRFAFMLLNTILGGDFMSCILNMRLREEEALVYDVCSNYAAYADTGTWNIYLGCDKSNASKAIGIVLEELEKLATAEIDEKELKLAKIRFLSASTIASENHDSWIIAVAKQYLNRGTVMSRDEVERNVNSVTAADIRECAAEFFDKRKLTTLIYN